MANTKRQRKPQNNMLVLRLLILVVIVLVVFEGKLIHTMFTQSGAAATPAPKKQETATPAETEAKSSTSSTSVTFKPKIYDQASMGLAGLTSLSISAVPAETEDTKQTVTEAIDNPKVVPAQNKKMDNSFFRDAVFIGDSRMEGFRNASGITQGDFLTSIGMALSQISDAKVATSEGNITVYQGLSGKQYDKIYIMLGANDLGFYPWDEFLNTAKSVLKQIHKLQPKATIYICSVIYVEEDKVVTDYVNNENVVKVNNYLLEACDELDYCYYLNLNEIFSNGYQSLIAGASADGVHLNAEYLEQMLDYLETHYVEAAVNEEVTEAETE